jgi:hypothetical protein
MATIAIAISSFNPRIALKEQTGVGFLTISDATNMTAALRIGLKGYILAQLAEPAEPLVIPANGELPVTVELWFVSYDWETLWSTNITLSPKVTMGNLTAISQPYGALTLQVNKPAVINVTLHNSGSNSMMLGVNRNALIVDIDADFPVLDSSTHVNTRKPALSVHPSNVTDEDTVTIKVFNPGPWTIDYGDEFQVEKMVNGSWTPVVTRSVWLAYLANLGAGSEGSQKVNATGLDSGRYRVSKEIGFNGEKQRFYDEFNITRPAEGDNVLPRWGLRFEAGVAEASIESPDRPMVMLQNMGARTLYIDDSYTLLRLVDAVYEPFSLRDSSGNVTSVAWGSTYRQIISEPKLLVGDYRVVKVIGIQGTSATKILQMDFHWDG